MLFQMSLAKCVKWVQKANVYIIFSTEILVYYFNSKHVLYTMTSQRLKKIKAPSVCTAGSLLPSDVALPNCQPKQVGYTVPLNSGQAEVAVPQASEGSPA